MTLTELVRCLKEAGCHPRRNGRSWRARCPAHDDEHPSLSASPGEGGRLLVKCHAGCSTESVVKALGLSMADLFPAKDTKATKRGLKAKEDVTRYEIRTPDGELVAVHERRDTATGKKMSWKRPNGTAGLNGIATRDLPLYGVDLLSGEGQGPVVVTEGEKAAQSLLSRNVQAVGTVTGASGTPGDEALRPLLDFSVVYLWPDNDDAGRGHMDRVGSILLRLGHQNVRVVDWPEAPAKADAADFAGDVDELLSTAMAFIPSQVVDAGSLLDEVKSFILRFIVLGDAEATICALWTLHTHTIDAAHCTAYLHVHSPEKNCGKTRLLEVLSLITARPWFSSNTTAAALMRVVAAAAPTVLLDEVDATLVADPDSTERIRALLNAGYQRGGVATVCEKGPTGFEVRKFPVFCPKAISGIGRLPDTIESRSIPIGMRRRSAEPIERLRRRDVEPEAGELRERLAAWAVTAIDQLREARLRLPNELSDRQADACEPLLAIADVAAGHWPLRARLALVELCTKAAAEDESLGVKLLADIKRVLRDRGRLLTAELLAELNGLDESPWATLHRGKPLDARRLATRLRPYGISSRNLRLPDGRVVRGYRATDFDDAWKRYLPSGRAVYPLPRYQPAESRVFSTPASATGTPREADGDPPEMALERQSSGVADETPQTVGRPGWGCDANDGAGAVPGSRSVCSELAQSRTTV